ncbi:MAG: EF-P beta-lysylation protein EpmB [Methylococcales bacterium]|nr:EF-P beta-lysylation protein EpmB [Methylococcales bacterium]
MDSEVSAWQRALAEAFTSVDSLCRYLDIKADSLPLNIDCQDFPLRVPKGYADCMQPGNPRDPLLRQVLPVLDELKVYPGYSADPVGDLQAVATPGVIHKYQGRVLMIVTGACAIHCRYCFRRNFPYGELQLGSQKIQQAVAYIAGHSDISEVILSGGDPLLLSDDRLNKLLGRLARIPHVKRLRIHSRVPVVLPSRITATLLENLDSTGKQIVLVIHANHANELSAEVGRACERMRQSRITLLNQSVLLKGVNDDAASLCTLSERLFAIGVLPYYLHLLDHASGTGHFAVAERQALGIYRHMRENLPGYLLPRLVREQAGAAYKLPLFEPDAGL